MHRVGMIVLQQDDSANGHIWRYPRPRDWACYNNPNITDERSRLTTYMREAGDCGTKEKPVPSNPQLYTHWDNEKNRDGTLYELLIDCWRLRPEDRPTLKDVLGRIQQWLRDNPEPANDPAVVANQNRFTYWFGHMEREMMSEL